MGRVENRVAIVTGGALGIGKACCEVLAREGANVAVTDILDKEGKKLAEEIKGAGGVAEYRHLDVAKEKEIKTIVGERVAEGVRIPQQLEVRSFRDFA